MKERISVIDSVDSVRLIALVSVSKDAVTMSVTNVVTSLYKSSVKYVVGYNTQEGLHDSGH